MTLFLRVLSGFLGGFLFLQLVTSCSHKNVAPSHPEPAEKTVAKDLTTEAAWRERMTALSNLISRLYPEIMNPERFNADKNQEQIKADTAELRKLAHRLNADTVSPKIDPSLRLTASLLETDLDRSQEALRNGHREYARQTLRDTTSYCIQCHTQTDNGPKFPSFALNIDTKELRPIEKGEIFAATRQFAKALAAFQTIIESTEIAKKEPFTWEKAVRASLAIAVQANHDRALAEKLASEVAKNKNAPEFMREPVRGWMTSLKEWQREPANSIQSPEAKLKKAKALIEKASRHMAFPLDHSQDVAYFRAASLLHDWLGLGLRKNPSYAKALYLSGVATEATRDMNFWTLHETYYELCIHADPHSKMASTCYDHLKNSLYSGYTGSSGVSVPEEIENRLAILRSEAEPEATAAEKPPEKVKN